MLKIIIPIIIAIVLIIFAFWFGGKVALHKKAKKMIAEMNFGSIIIDMTSVESETISCEFDRNPREMLKYNYILMEVAVRQ